MRTSRAARLLGQGQRADLGRGSGAARGRRPAGEARRRARMPKLKKAKKPMQAPRRSDVTVTLYVGPHGKAAVGRVLRRRRTEIDRRVGRVRGEGGDRVAAARSARTDREARDPLQVAESGASADGLRADRGAAARAAHRARLRRARARCRRRPRATSAGEFPVAELRELGALGLLGDRVPEAARRRREGTVAYSLAMQELARARCVGRGRGLASRTWSPS